MTSELRKSLESIQSLLSQAKSPSSIGVGVNISSSTSRNTPNNVNFSVGDNVSAQNSNQDVFRSSNEQRMHHQFETSHHQIGPSVSFQLRSVISPTNNESTPATQSYASHANRSAQSADSHVDSYAARKETSSTTSLCNFVNSPYNHKEVRPFSSDEHGGIIGSPLSAFSEFRRQPEEIASIAGSAGSGGKKGRETSLLVSPLGDNGLVGDTPGTVRQQIASPDNLSQVRTSLYGNTKNSHARDPTPYHHRQHSPPPSNTSNRSDTSRESRSGMDPPAKSPFGAALAMTKPTLSVRTERDEDLSMIQESASYESKYESKLDQSLTSEVTGLTLPRTPVWRGHMTPMSVRSRASAITGVTGGTTASPSKIMRDSLVQLANQTASRLESLWDTIGVHPDERMLQLSDLIDTLSRVCDDKISEEEGCVAQFRKEIDDMKSEWEKSCVALGIEKSDPLEKLRRDPSARELPGEGLSLQCEYEAIVGRLEIIRAAMAAAREDAAAYQQRIYEAYRALNGDDASASGELEQWSDVETDLTEETREKFRAKALELEESVASRTKAVVSLTLECQNLMRELEIDSESSENLFGGEPEIMNSLQSTGHEEKDDLHYHVRQNRTSDKYTIVSLFETPTCLGIGKSALDRLTTRLTELNGEKRRRRSILAEMGQAIQALWAMLRVPPEEQKAFTDSIRGLSMDTIRKGERELDRLHELKVVMIGRLIRDQRKKIEVLWEQTNASSVEKASFDEYFHVYDDDKLTDKLLAKHEEYALTLNTKLQKMQPILDLIAKREAIVSERFDLEMLQKDPERLKGRFATKQLMKEEKMTRRVQKELPRITSMLEKALLEWYHDNRLCCTEDQQSDPNFGHFLYQGAPYLETMHNQEHDWKIRKEVEEQERHRKRDEERSTKHNNAFGSTYTKLPGRKWNPSIGSTSSSTIGKKSDELRPRSASNTRAASNPRGGPPRPLADVSGSRGNVPRAASRSRNGDKPVAGSGKYNVPGYRAASAPRPRL
ncbi:hypothetical protein ACHAW6_010525 [Cyclotella cf. meneghiniana]